VECDSYQFHERSAERSTYEKQRDRYLQYLGLMTLHYSGREINADPFRVAAEALGHVVQYSKYPKDVFQVSLDEFYYRRIKKLATQNDVVAKAESMLRNSQ